MSAGPEGAGLIPHHDRHHLGGVGGIQLDRLVEGSRLQCRGFDELNPFTAAQKLPPIDKLLTDLQSRDVPGIEFLTNEPVLIPGIGSVAAPILARGNGGDRIFYIQSPLTRDTPPTQELWNAKDDIIVTRNLPVASQQVLRWLS